MDGVGGGVMVVLGLAPMVAELVSDGVTDGEGVRVCDADAVRVTDAEGVPAMCAVGGGA
jgi:hypothetical protein